MVMKPAANIQRNPKNLSVLIKFTDQSTERRSVKKGKTYLESSAGLHNIVRRETITLLRSISLPSVSWTKHSETSRCTHFAWNIYEENNSTVICIRVVYI